MKLSLSIPRQILATKNRRLFVATSQQELETAEVLFDPKSAWQIIQCFADNPQDPTAISGSDLQRYSLNPQYLASVPAICRGGAPGYNSFASLQNDSISVKTVWAITAAEAGDISAEIPAWDWEFPEGQITLDHPWQAKVSVVLDPSTPCTDPSQWGNQGVQDNVRLNFAVQVPSKCFYSVPLSWNDLSTAVGIKRDALRQNSGWSKSIYLILLGFHVITKEIPNWTWQTFWWSGRPGGDDNLNYPFSTESPALQAAVGSQWSHFVMTTTFGKPPSDNTHVPAIVYNPYLEGLLTNGDGTKSNCASCHQYAAFATAAPLDHAALGYQLGMVRSSDSPLSCSSADPNPSSYFEGAENMDCLWSLSESNAFPSSEPIKTDLNQTVLNLLGKINTDLRHKSMKVPKK